MRLKSLIDQRMAIWLVGLFVIVCLLSVGSILSAQSSSSQSESTVEEGVTNINWDEEEDDSTNQSVDLSDTNWDEGMDDDMSEEENAIAINQSNERKLIEDKEFVVHAWGFLLFACYFIGGVFTAYFTRERKVSVHYAPELLIVLHTFWPIEWIFLIFAGQKVK